MAACSEPTGGRGSRFGNRYFGICTGSDRSHSHRGARSYIFAALPRIARRAIGITMTLHYAASRYMSLLTVGLVATLQVASAATEKQISAGELRSLRAQYERPAAVPEPANNPITA